MTLLPVVNSYILSPINNHHHHHHTPHNPNHRRTTPPYLTTMASTTLSPPPPPTTTPATSSSKSLQSICDRCNNAIAACTPEYIKTCRVQLAPSPTNFRLGLVATESIRKGDTVLAIPYSDQTSFTPDLAVNTVFKDVLSDEYEGWTGDNGLLALLLLNELARASTTPNAGIPLPLRPKPEPTELLHSWLAALPTPDEATHPILWEESAQEELQSSSTKKVYRLLDDIDEDADWLEEMVWGVDRETFPEVVEFEGGERECFSGEGFKWAMAIVSSRAVFVNNQVRLIPFLDMANHNDIGVDEIRGGTMGLLGTTKGAVLNAGHARKYAKGDEVFCSYGPKSAAEYLLEHGFIPDKLRSFGMCIAEVSFEISEEDGVEEEEGEEEGGADKGVSPFYDDKLDVLEFETYDQAPMAPTQSFDVVSQQDQTESEPDPAMIQFLRLAKLAGKDAFLLESVFRKDVWGFMSLPVSERNERDSLEAVADACSAALGGMEGASLEKVLADGGSGDDPSVLCAVVRESEGRALGRTLEFVNREKEALDLKEYYQERRLKDLGLDSEWNTDESSAKGSAFDVDDELGYGQVRTPGNMDW